MARSRARLTILSFVASSMPSPNRDMVSKTCRLKRLRVRVEMKKNPIHIAFENSLRDRLVARKKARRRSRLDLTLASRHLLLVLANTRTCSSRHQYLPQQLGQRTSWQSLVYSSFPKRA